MSNYKLAYKNLKNIVLVDSPKDLKNIESDKHYVVTGEIDIGDTPIVVPPSGLSMGGFAGSRDKTVLKSSNSTGKIMDVIIDIDSGTVQVPQETRILKGAWDSNFTADVLVQRKTDLEIDWTTVDTITAQTQAAMKLVNNVNSFRYEHSVATNWRFKHNSEDLASEEGTFGAMVFNV